MKKFLLVLLLSSCMVPVLARGAMSGEQDLRSPKPSGWLPRQTPSTRKSLRTTGWPPSSGCRW